MGYASPTSLREALSLLADDTTMTPVAGGTDFYPSRVGQAISESVLDLSGVTELRGVDASGPVVRIGALTTWTEIAAATLPPSLRALQEAAVEIGGRQVQNVATIGGNLCNSSPAADGVPPLLVVDASVELASRDGTRTVALADFLTGYRATSIRDDEVLTAVTVPARSGGSSFLKLGSRRYLVISIVMVAARVALDGAGFISEAAVAVGACSPVAQRLTDLESALVGVPSSEIPDIQQQHLSPLEPIDDPRAPATYRTQAAAVMVKRALEAAVS